MSGPLMVFNAASRKYANLVVTEPPEHTSLIYSSIHLYISYILKQQFIYLFYVHHYYSSVLFIIGS